MDKISLHNGVSLGETSPALSVKIGKPIITPTTPKELYSFCNLNKTSLIDSLLFRGIERSKLIPGNTKLRESSEYAKPIFFVPKSKAAILFPNFPLVEFKMVELLINLENSSTLTKRIDDHKHRLFNPREEVCCVPPFYFWCCLPVRPKSEVKSFDL